jgi:hypothetical protein
MLSSLFIVIHVGAIMCLCNSHNFRSMTALCDDWRIHPRKSETLAVLSVITVRVSEFPSKGGCDLKCLFCGRLSDTMTMIVSIDQGLSMLTSEIQLKASSLVKPVKKSLKRPSVLIAA